MAEESLGRANLALAKGDFGQAVLAQPEQQAQGEQQGEQNRVLQRLADVFLHQPPEVHHPARGDEINGIVNLMQFSENRPQHIALHEASHPKIVGANRPIFG